MTRHDFYAPIHKGIRLALSNLVVRIGQTDFADPAAAAETMAALRRQMAMSANHLEHEEAEVHGPLEERISGGSRTLEEAHDHHRASFARLEGMMQALEAASEADERRAIGRELYLRFTTFVAEDFAHMAEEEMVTLPLLHAHFTDDELREMEGRIVASLAPEEAIAEMQLMIPAMNRDERIRFLSFARSAAPPEAFEAIMNFAARPTLGAEDYRHLSGGLGLAA
jgi:hypothetical protein